MSPFKATIFLAVGLCLFANYINAEEKGNTDDDENTIKVYKRLIPADVLRGLYIMRFFPLFFFSSVEIKSIEKTCQYLYYFESKFLINTQIQRV